MVVQERVASGRFVLIWMAVMFAVMVLPFGAIGVVTLVRTPTAAASAPAAVVGPAPGTRSPACPDGSGLVGVVSDQGAEVVAGSEVVIAAADSFFDPTCSLEVPAGSASMIVTNTGQILHNVTVKSLGIAMNVRPGETITLPVEVGVDPVVFFCKFHRTSGMWGSLLPASSRP